MPDFIGDCVNSFDEDGTSLIPIFEHVSDFACVEEQSHEVSQIVFSALTGSEDRYDEYLFNPERGILMGYNYHQDIHYFYEKLP